MKLREIYRSPNYYSVCETDRTRGLVLCVVTGGILMSTVIVELLPDEIAQFESKGHLDNLACQVSKNQSKFHDRILKPSPQGERLEFVDSI
jgi:hypothetical protein